MLTDHELRLLLQRVNNEFQGTFQRITELERKVEELSMPKSKDPKLARAGVSGYNKPKRTPSHPTKKFVVVAKDGDKTKTIRFGDAKMTIKKDQPARRKSFRARHKCDTNPPSKLTARYWSCKKW